MQIKLFGYNVVLSLNVEKTTPDPSKKVMKLLDAHIDSQRYYSSLKIERIKFIRRFEISKMFIDAGMVPLNEIRDDDGQSHQYVGLAWAKNWVEKHYL